MNLKNKHFLCLSILLSMALQITAVSTDEWSIKKLGGNNSISIGLWKECNKLAGGHTTCNYLPILSDITFPRSSLYAVRIFAILAVLFNLTALQCSCDTPNDKVRLTRLLFASGLCGMIAMVVWAKDLAKIDGVKYTLGYSFHLNWVGALVPLVSSLALGLSKAKLN